MMDEWVNWLLRRLLETFPYSKSMTQLCCNKMNYGNTGDNVTTGCLRSWHCPLTYLLLQTHTLFYAELEFGATCFKTTWVIKPWLCPDLFFMTVPRRWSLLQWWSEASMLLLWSCILRCLTLIYRTAELIHRLKRPSFYVLWSESFQRVCSQSTFLTTS